METGVNNMRHWSVRLAAVSRRVLASGAVVMGLLALLPAPAQAQSSFGTCDARMFFDQVNSTPNPDQSTLSLVNYATSPFTYTALGSGLARNAIGYNPVDNYIYGIEWDGAAGNELIRVASNGSSTVVGTVAGLPVGNYTSGAISPTGQLYIREGSVSNILYRVDIATLTATTITLSQSFSVQDLAWHNGALYAIVNGGGLARIDPVTGATTITAAASTTPITGSIAMWGFANALLAYYSPNIYAIDPVTGAATRLSDAPVSFSGDGANCTLATFVLDADLSLTKTNTPGVNNNVDQANDTYLPGTNVTYTIVVRNTGPFGAENVTVSDPLPTGITTASWTCGTPTGGARCGAASGTGALNDTGADLPPNSSLTYTFTVTVPAGFTGPLSNTATVVPPSSVNDLTPSNNTATDTDQARPTLTLRKISVGGVGSFDFTGSNGLTAQTLTTATAGTAVTGAPQTLSTAGTATTVTESALPATYRVTDIACTGLGAGGTATPDLVNRTVTLDAAATAGGSAIVCTFTNTLQQTDLQVVKTASPDPVVTGDVVTYQIVVSNNGPLDANNVILSDVAGPGQDCTAPSTTAACTATGGATCPSPTVPVADLLGSGIVLPSLPVGGQVNVQLQCQVTANGL